MITGLFAIELPFWVDEPAPAFAEIERDLLDEPIAKLTFPVGDFMDVRWSSNVWLRHSFLGNSIELIVDSEGDWSVENSFSVEELSDDVQNQLASDHLEDVLIAMFAAASPVVRTSVLTEEGIEWWDSQPGQLGVAAEHGRRGRWSRVTEIKALADDDDTAG